MHTMFGLGFGQPKLRKLTLYIWYKNLMMLASKVGNLTCKRDAWRCKNGMQSRWQGFCTCHLRHLQKVTLCSLDFAYIKNANQAQQKLC